MPSLFLYMVLARACYGISISEDSDFSNILNLSDYSFFFSFFRLGYSFTYYFLTMAVLFLPRYSSISYFDMPSICRLLRNSLTYFPLLSPSSFLSFFLNFLSFLPSICSFGPSSPCSACSLSSEDWILGFLPWGAESDCSDSYCSRGWSSSRIHSRGFS